MTALTPLWHTTLLPERCYWPAGEDSLDDRYLTYQRWSQPRPIPVGIVWLGQFVSLIGGN